MDLLFQIPHFTDRGTRGRQMTQLAPINLELNLYLNKISLLSMLSFTLDSLAPFASM